MTQDVILPWRSTGEPWRQKHVEFLADYYGAEFNVILADCEGEFNRSAARNTGVRLSNSPISVVIDADNYIPIDQIHTAIDVAKKNKALVKPFTTFGYLTEESTNIFYEAFGISDIEPEFINPPADGFTGGAYVMRRELWIGLGGMDEGFIGWGAEDDAFHLLIKNSKIPTIYVDGYDWHLYHPAYRMTSTENYDKLMSEYVRGKRKVEGL